MAAEIKVHNRKHSKQRSADKSQGSPQQQRQRSSASDGRYGQRVNQSASPEPPKPVYDTRNEDGKKLNANQKKPYNAKFEFFTKGLGPGHYEPKMDLTKKRNQGTSWCASRSIRQNSEDAKIQKDTANPGPTEYVF